MKQQVQQMYQNCLYAFQMFIKGRTSCMNLKQQELACYRISITIHQHHSIFWIKSGSVFEFGALNLEQA
jgi:hypothetical protein